MEAMPELTLRQKTLLVFLNAGEGRRFDPIRIMKGLFLFAKKAPDNWLPSEARYEFAAYDYGPCSFEIYSDLDFLEWRGCVRSSEVPGYTWKYYELTERGMDVGQRAQESMNPDAARYLKEIRDFVSKLSFRQLLAVVYKQYPEYAVNSVFKF